MNQHPSRPSGSGNKGRRLRRGPIAWMAQNSIAANLLMVLLLGGGIWSAMTIQKEVFPQFLLDIVEVSVEPLPKKSNRESCAPSKKPFVAWKAFAKSPVRLGKVAGA